MATYIGGRPIDCGMCGDDGDGNDNCNDWEWTGEEWMVLCEDCADLDAWPSGMQINRNLPWEEPDWLCICGEIIYEEEGYEENGFWYCGICDSDDEYSTGQPVVTLQGPPLQPPIQNSTSQFENRRRNLRDLQTLRKAYPAYCTHHLFYRHVLQQPNRGCSLVTAEAEGCNQGGRLRSHDMPDDLADQDLLAFKA